MCFTRCKIKESTSKDKIREKLKNKSIRKRKKTNCMWLCLILSKCAFSVIRADRVASNIYQVHFRFVLMLKEMCFLLNRAFFYRFPLNPALETSLRIPFSKLCFFQKITSFYYFEICSKSDLLEIRQNQ